MVLKSQPLHPKLSHIFKSYSKGLKEIRVLWEEQPPRTLALECRICELPRDQLVNWEQELEFGKLTVGLLYSPVIVIEVTS